MTPRNDREIRRARRTTPPRAARADVALARRIGIAALLAFSALSTGCAIVAVADAAVTVAATAVSVTAKTVGAVVDAVIPDGDDKKKD